MQSLINSLLESLAELIQNQSTGEYDRLSCSAEPQTDLKVNRANDGHKSVLIGIKDQSNGGKNEENKSNYRKKTPLGKNGRVE